MVRFGWSEQPGRELPPAPSVPVRQKAIDTEEGDATRTQIPVSPISRWSYAVALTQQAGTSRYATDERGPLHGMSDRATIP
jgi:hypothetical protein